MMLNPDPQSRHDERGDLVTLDDARPQKRGHLWLAAKTLVSMVLALAIVAGAVTIMQRLMASQPQMPQRPAVEREVPVLTETVALTTHSPAITVYGEIVTGRVVDLRALVGGEITAVHPDLEAGRRIEEGAALVEIDRFAYEGAVIEAQANLAEARAGTAESEARSALERDQLARAIEQVDLAERDLERARQLAERGSLTERDVETRQLTLSQRQQAVEQRQANLRIEEARLDQQRAAIDRLEWRLAQARRDLERTTLTAPFAGVIRSESVEIGRLVSVNDVVATIYDDSAFNVRFTLSDSQFGRLAGEDEPLVGRLLTVTWSAGGQDIELNGTIDRLDADITAASGGVALFGRLDVDEATVNLRPGAFVSVSLSDRAFENTMRIPETALYNTDHIFIVVEDRLLRQAVELVAWDGDHALVRPVEGADLDGAEVVTSRLTDAGDGIAIRRIQPAS